MRPRVSIIMPCYNGADHLLQSVGSIRSQTHSDWELVLIDDGSTDGSPDLIRRLTQEERRIVALRQPNAGLVAARNRGLSAARGEFIAFLDADDSWHPEFLSEMTAALDANPKAAVAYCGWQNVGARPPRDRPYVPPDYEADRKLELLLKDCPWPVHAALVRAPFFEAHGAFDDSFSACEDYDLWLRLAMGNPIVRVARVLAYYHHHGGEQMTRDKARIALNHFKVQEKFLSGHPQVRRTLGSRKVREVTLGQLLRRGYAAYWSRDLPASRAIFREVIKHGYGAPRDWLYMFSSLWPYPWQRKLLAWRDLRRAGPHTENEVV